MPTPTRRILNAHANEPSNKKTMIRAPGIVLLWITVFPISYLSTPGTGRQAQAEGRKSEVRSQKSKSGKV